MSVVIGIDVGGSTTKIVGFRNKNGQRELIQPQFVKANDPITSIYGAFGKFTDQNNLSLSEIEKVMMTGVGSAYLKRGLYGLECINVPEFQSIGLGGLYLSGLDNALCVSMGTGTALVHSVLGGKMTYLGGTGVGGGTLMGLSRLLLNADEIDHIEMHPNNRVLFVFADGHVEEHFWKDHSRKDSWDAEKRKKAAEKTREQRKRRKEQTAQ